LTVIIEPPEVHALKFTGDYCPLVFTGDHNKPSRNVLRIVDYQCICKSSRMIHIDSSFGNMRRTDPRICEVPSSRQKLYQVMDAPEYAGKLLNRHGAHSAD